MRRAAKRDQSEAGIVKALKAAGCDVERGTDCDLYVQSPNFITREIPDGSGLLFMYGPYQTRSYLLECKTPGPNVKRRQPIQKRLQAIFGPWQYHVVDSPEAALKAVGLA